MADFTIKAGLLNAANRVLNGTVADAGVLPLLSNATPKGRYALARAADAVSTAAVRYTKQHIKELEAHAVKGPDNQPLTQTIEQNGDKLTQYDFGRGFGVTTPEFEKVMAELNDEDVILPGVRQTLMAELGTANISGVHLLVLIKCGLLEDKEPE